MDPGEFSAGVAHVPWGALATDQFVGRGFAAFVEEVSRGEQIVYQLIGIGASWGWAFVVTALIMLALRYTIGIRVSPEEEAVGLDDSQHGEPAYEL